MDFLSVVHSEDSAEYWEARIRPHLARSVDAIVEVGHEFIVAKQKLFHGEFIRLTELLRISDRTARRFMAIANHDVLANRTHASDLPASWMTLYELSRLETPQLEAAIHDGRITPELERKAAVQLVAEYRTSGAPDDEESLEPIPIPEGTFSTITADPPWQYDNRGTRAAAADHYSTLTIPELCELEVDGKPVVECAATGAHLYLWTTNAFLRQSFEVMEAWGFEYKTTLVWVKPQMGIGNYFRSSHEYVLFGVRGGLHVLNSNQMSWFEALRGRHSRKPDYFYELVETVSPGPYLELFGRPDPLLGPRPSWTVWGNET